MTVYSFLTDSLDSQCFISTRYKNVSDAEYCCDLTPLDTGRNWCNLSFLDTENWCNLWSLLLWAMHLEVVKMFAGKSSKSLENNIPMNYITWHFHVRPQLDTLLFWLKPPKQDSIWRKVTLISRRDRWAWTGRCPNLEGEGFPWHWREQRQPCPNGPPRQ